MSSVAGPAFWLVRPTNVVFVPPVSNSDVLTCVPESDSRSISVGTVGPRLMSSPGRWMTQSRPKFAVPDRMSVGPVNVAEPVELKVPVPFITNVPELVMPAFPLKVPPVIVTVPPLLTSPLLEKEPPPMLMLPETVRPPPPSKMLPKPIVGIVMTPPVPTLAPLAEIVPLTPFTTPPEPMVNGWAAALVMLMAPPLAVTVPLVDSVLVVSDALPAMMSTEPALFTMPELPVLIAPVGRLICPLLLMFPLNATSVTFPAVLKLPVELTLSVPRLALPVFRLMLPPLVLAPVTESVVPVPVRLNVPPG